MVTIMYIVYMSQPGQLLHHCIQILNDDGGGGVNDDDDIIIIVIIIIIIIIIIIHGQFCMHNKWFGPHQWHYHNV